MDVRWVSGPSHVGGAGGDFPLPEVKDSHNWSTLRD